jgi:hypothetical protein
MPMRCHRRHFIAALGGLALGAATRPVLALSEPLCVIVGAKSAQVGISLAELRRVFLGAATNDVSGRRFIPLNAVPHSAQRVMFDRRVLDMNPDEAARHWIDQRIRGGQAPRTSDSVDIIMRVVAHLPGAISYVPRSLLHDDVRPLLIDGKSASDATYVLHA